MEESNDLFRTGINARQIARFVRVAPITRECKIAQVIKAAMFFWNDVVYLKTEEWFVLLPKTAIFANAVGSLPNIAAHCLVDHDFRRWREMTARALACKIAITVFADT